MGGASLPPGFRFHPTDEELVGYYLHRKVQGLEMELEVIPVIDLYKFDPWELPEKSFLPKRDMEWFFFCPRDRKYPNGSRTNRATKAGYWKATGKDRQVTCQSSLTGYRKTLVFYRGRAPLGDRTDWVMHEYRLSDEGSSVAQAAFALCRVVKKNEPKSKAIASSSSNNGDFNSTVVSNELMGTLASSHQSTPTSDFEPPSAKEGNQSSSLWVSQDYILDSSKDYPQVTQYFPQFEYSSSMTTCWQTQEQRELSSSSSYSNFIGETEDFNRMDYMSPYSTEYMGFGENEDMHYEYYDQTSSQGYFGN